MRSCSGVSTSDPQPYVGSANAKRGIFVDPPGMSVAYNRNAPLLSNRPSLPEPAGEHVATQRGIHGWLTGFSWTLGYPWHAVVNRYTHYNTPNK